MTQKTLGGAAGDFIVHMESPQKCLTYGQITMPASGGAHALTAAQLVGYPLKASNVLAIAGEEASVVAFIVAGEAFSAKANDAVTTGPLYTILNYFDGCVLNEDAVQTADCAATPGTFNLANIKTALAGIDAALPKWVDEAEQQTEQTS